MEFVILMTFMMIIFTSMFVVIQQKTLDVREDQTGNEVESLSNVIVTEIELAHKVTEGYENSFWIPDYINGEEYNVTLMGGEELVVSYKGKIFLTFFSTNRTNVSGTIDKGYNRIWKNSTGIYIEPIV